MILQLIKGKRIVCYLCIIVVVSILVKDSIWGKEEVTLAEGLENETSLSLTGVVTGLEEKEYCQYIYVKTSTYKWLIYDYEFLDLSLGNEICVVGELEYFDVARNPGNFDFENYYHTKKIVAGLSAESIEIINDSKFIVLNYLYELRLKGVEHIYNILGEEEGSLLVAMVFGEKNGMDAEQKELYQKMGISHIFAISGLHISLISLVLYKMLRRATGSFLVAGITSSIFLFLYVLLIGVSISAVRASIMFVMRIGADITGREYDIRTSLAIAAMCILISNPLYLYDGGFLLSFGAILGVIYVVPILEKILLNATEKLCVISEKKKNKNMIKEKLVQGLSASIGIQLVILPILLYFYYEISPYSIILNIIVIPIMTLLLGIALVGIILSLVWYGAGALLLYLSGWLLQVINFLSETALGFYKSRIVIGQPWWIMILIYYIVLVVFVFYAQIINDIELEEYKRTNIYRVLAMICCGLPLILIIPDDLWEPVDLMVTMIDVDQGDSIFITGSGLGNYLIDGGSTGIDEVGKYRIEPYLRSIGVDHLDYVFISHGDSDHLNGIEEMLARQNLGIEIGTIVVCGEAFLDDGLIELIAIAQEYDTEVAIIEAGTSITDGGLEITCIAPLNTYVGDIGNESSMILEVSMDELQILFTGDVEGEGEEQLIEILEETRATYQILKVAHHGSSNSTTTEFLDLIQPEVALISAGVDSIYGHPHEETLERLDFYGCDIYTTPANGGVVLSYKSNDDTITIEETIISGE